MITKQRPQHTVQPFENMAGWEKTAHLLARHNTDPRVHDPAPDLSPLQQQHDRRHDLDLDHTHAPAEAPRLSTKRSTSWGHTLQKLTEDQLAILHEWSRVCRVTRTCHQPVTHLATYCYITGRGGRASWAKRYQCDGHAAKYAAKHGLPAPAVAPMPHHALERLAAGQEG
jgi:hypothetical protein